MRQINASLNKMSIEPSAAMEVDKDSSLDKKKVIFCFPRLFSSALADTLPQGKVRFLEYYDVPGMVFDYAFYKANNRTNNKHQRTTSAPCMYDCTFPGSALTDYFSI